MEHDDPRSRGFRSRTSVESVLDLIRARVEPLGSESVAVVSAGGRVLSSQVTSSIDVPSFDRAAMDGFAVKGAETFGADAYTPATFRRVGRSRPGRPCEVRVDAGQAVEIATGAPIPFGADTVVKVESTSIENDIVHVFEPTPPGRHVGLRGEDVSAGTVVLPAGRALRPQDLGLLSAIGFTSIDVVRRPRVAILVTGDELLAPGAQPRDYRIVDSNSPMLAALAIRDGGVVEVRGPIRDEREGLREAIEAACGEFDVVLISGGTSTGPEDHAPALVASLGDLAVHGVAIRPASPTGLGFVAGTPVVLLPGNPVSCLCAYDFFAGPIVRARGGRSTAMPHREMLLPLAHKISSIIGRVDYVRARVVDRAIEPIAIGGASILSSATRADGFVIVPADSEGYPPGAKVGIMLYDS